ncbi:MAG: hypothetical protein FWC09_10205 [Lachnospiraceae bacterium]|nr:hypothetical protein [Lachnospiraceae bacterium]
MTKKNFGTIILFSLFILTACTNHEIQQLREEHPPLVAAFIVDGTMNGLAPEAYIPFIPSDIMNRAVAEHSAYAIVSVSKSPKLFRSVIPEFTAVTESQWRTDHAFYLGQLRTDLREKSKPQEEGLDLIQAISIATNFVNATAKDFDYEVEKVIVIVSSFLTVDGEFAFNDNNVHAYFKGDRNLINDRVDTTVSYLLENNIVSDLSGISVYAMVGQTSPPQSTLSSNQRNLLWNFFETLFTEANAKAVTKIAGNTGVSSSSILPVVTVKFPKEEGITFGNIDDENDDGQPDLGEVDESESEIWFLGEEKVRFIPDTDTYDDPEYTIKILLPIAEWLLQPKNTETSILLVGCTAGDTNNDFTLNLSLARANAVKSSLEALGVSTDRLKAIGLGSDNIWHISGLKLSDPLSQMNRQVVLVQSDSETAMKILAKYELP